ncbi:MULTISPECIES: hypothetical protein [Azospirillaceae]|uniref:hypothetical protein n=1 Tax=Azospirillaceae TaxID=2829815 RepID=UPI000B661D47|nr:MULTISPECIES: hypothetical protein [Azospirillaceae]MDG5496969.1 hypothetical protein [Niveispirillum sp. BGYR6]SNS83735.1 hypothetical protein SAMN05880556_11323 [Azospirillum sp. RU38E]SNT00937.1 hypothetical protein SAMN05880591_11322 [Azospirillum sp. RU37A]
METKRQRIIKAVQAVLERLQAGQPADDPYGISFTKIYREVLDDGLVKGKAAVAAVLDKTETKLRLVNHDQCTLRVNVEFHVMYGTGDQRADRMNAVLGDIQRAFRSDFTLGGVAINCTEAGNEIDSTGRFTGYGSGTLLLDILYRHAKHDPRLG